MTIGTPTRPVNFSKSRKFEVLGFQLGQIPGHQQHDYQFNEFRDLEMITCGSDPAPGAEGRHADHVGRDQGSHRKRIQNRDLAEQRVIVDQAWRSTGPGMPRESRSLVSTRRRSNGCRGWR